MPPPPRRAKGRLAAVVLAWGLGAGCGGAPAVVTAPPSQDAAQLTLQAREAWRSLSVESAAGLADRAIAAGGGTEALEIAARAHLARGDHAAALESLHGASSPHLRRLRARAQIGLLDYPAAAATLADDDDPWARAVRPALLAVGGRRPYEAAGEATDLDLEQTPLPTLWIELDGAPALALISSGAGFMVVDPTVRAEGGAVDRLTLGELTLSAVPFIARSLAHVRETLQAPVTVVLGLELLLRLHARLDGPGRTVRFSATPPPTSPDATAAPLYTATGSFLMVDGQLGAERVWLVVDTSGLFPLALAPGAEELLPGALWRDAQGGLRLTVLRALRVGTMQVEQIPVVRGLLDDGFARAVGAPTRGSLGWGLLGQMVLRFDPEARRLIFE